MCGVDSFLYFQKKVDNRAAEYEHREGELPCRLDGPLQWSKTGCITGYNLNVNGNSFVQIWRKSDTCPGTVTLLTTLFINGVNDAVTIVGTPKLDQAGILSHPVPTVSAVHTPATVTSGKMSAAVPQMSPNVSAMPHLVPQQSIPQQMTHPIAATADLSTGKASKTTYATRRSGRGKTKPYSPISPTVSELMDNLGK